MATPTAGRARAAFLVLLGTLLLAQGCLGFQRDTSNVDQAKDEGYVQFLGGTAEDRIFLDGRAVGSGRDYAPDRVLAVTPGSHLIEIVRGGAVVRQERVYIGIGSTRTVVIR